MLLLSAPIWADARVVTAAQQQQQSQQKRHVGPAVERDEGRRVRVGLARGGKIVLGNRTTGRITVTGWDEDYVEAFAFSERGAEYVRASSDATPSGQVVSLKADYLTDGRAADEHRESVSPGAPRPPGVTPDPSGNTSGEDTRPGLAPPRGRSEFDQIIRSFFTPDQVHLEVKVPRYAELEAISVNRSDVEVTSISTPVVVSGRRSTIRLREVGALEVRTESGPVEIEGANGLVDVITTSGLIRVKDARGDVRALSLSGDVEIRCARGRVNVGNTEGSITLDGVAGDVDATTVNSDVNFSGAVREDGRYHLKTMSGSVVMTIRPTATGFTALLSSYRGIIESDFSLKSKQSAKEAGGSRVLGRYGDGKAQITLDSFDGKVKLGKTSPGGDRNCH